MSATLKVLKWGALGGGVVYGFMHNRTLAKNTESKRFNDEWARKEKLIEEAKAKYAELNKPKDTGNGPVTNPDDPNFDAEKLIDHAIKQLD